MPTIDELRSAIPGVRSWKALARVFGIKSSQRIAEIKRTCQEAKLDTEHFWKRRDPEAWCEHHVGMLMRGKLKLPLLRSGRKYECEECQCDGMWQGKELALQVDHRDGDSRNNRLENLRFLCPNCHAQTANFAGRNRRVAQG